MKNWKWWILGIVLILFVPVIPYEKETGDGVTEVGSQSISVYLYERYEKVQKQEKEKEGKTKPELKTEHAPVAQ